MYYATASTLAALLNPHRSFLHSSLSMWSPSIQAPIVGHEKPIVVQGGGNAANDLTCATRLGLNARLISKVSNDTQGRGILEEREADGVDTSFLVVSDEGNSPFTYIIVDKETKTRTCIHTPGSPPMIPDDLSKSSMLSALDGVRLVYFDVRLHETALVVAHEVKDCYGKGRKTDG